MSKPRTCAIISGKESAMTETLQNLIQQMTKEIYRTYNLPEINATTNLQNIIQMLGGKLRYSYDVQTETIQKTNDTAFCITLPARKSDAYNTFAVGQKLGDLFLYMKYQIDETAWNNIPCNQPFETDTSEHAELTNYFAGYFLMPVERFEAQLKEHTNNNKCNIGQVAKHFGVTPCAASWWSYKLGYSGL